MKKRESTSKMMPPKTMKPRRTIARRQSVRYQFGDRELFDVGKYLLSQMGEMGDFCAFSTFFLIWSSDLPRRASWSLTNLRFARRCCGVCACLVAEGWVSCVYWGGGAEKP